MSAVGGADGATLVGCHTVCRYGLEGTHAEAMADTGILITQMTWMTEFPRAVAPAVKLVGPILPEAAK